MSKRKNKNEWERLERARMAKGSSLWAATLLACTGYYFYRRLSQGEHAHIYLSVVVANLASSLFAVWAVRDWWKHRQPARRKQK